MSKEIEAIKALHKTLYDKIHGSHHGSASRVYMDGARLGQVGLHQPLLDENGHLWRYGQDSQGEFVEYVDQHKLSYLVREDGDAIAAFNVDHSMRCSEHDPDVKTRAKHAADAPYDQKTCARYPWAAAARIRFLEQEHARLVERERQLIRNLKGVQEIFDGGK